MPKKEGDRMTEEPDDSEQTEEEEWDNDPNED
jgi:hypothetical protein